MNREERVIAGVSMIQVMYAVFMFLSDGAFIFATPLNSLLFGVTAVYFATLNFKSSRWSIFFIFLGILSILISPLFIETILSAERLHYYFNSPLPDLLQFIYLIAIVSFGGITIAKQTSNSAKGIMIVFIVSYIGLQATNRTDLMILPFLFSLISSQLDRKLSPFHLLWILLFIFELLSATNQLLY